MTLGKEWGMISQANDQMHALKQEYEIIQSINADLSATSEKTELLKIIHFKLANLFAFSHHFVALLHEEDQTATSFLRDSESSSKGHPDYGRVITTRYPIMDGVFDKVLLSGDPLVFDLELMLGKGELPYYLQINYESGIRKVVMSVLRVKGRTIGIWAICQSEGQSMSAHQLSLIKSISIQFSIAVANIRAGEIIAAKELESERLLRLSQKREAECNILISLSNHIAAVRNNQELLAVVTTHLKNILGFKHTIIARIAEDGKTASGFLVDPKAVSRNHPLYRQAVHGQYPIADGVLDLAVDAEGPLVFDLESFTKRGTLPLYLQIHFESGCRQIVIIRFTENDRAFGFWILFFAHRDPLDAALLRLVAGIASQLSIAVQNIIANQRIRHQLEEISGYKARLEDEKIYLQEEIQTTHNYGDMIGKSAELQKVFVLVDQVASSDSTVMILGETGTGKELIARAIHNNSSRRNKLMVKVNCAALPANLIESELFGHERGSFTGATERRLGKFELAHNGSLFLDEIGEMPLELQVKLLRALQEREIERVGGRTTIKVDVRIIAATNRDLEKEMKEGRFRRDLYFRLNIFPIHLPPLRHRVEDIPLLAAHFVSFFAKKTGKKISTLSNKVVQLLQQYSWPGNIRELEHLIERSILLTSGDTLKHIVLPAATPVSVAPDSNEDYILKTIEDNERDHILSTLKFCRGRVDGPGGAANILGVPPSTLHSKIKRLGIKREHFK